VGKIAIFWGNSEIVFWDCCEIVVRLLWDCVFWVLRLCEIVVRLLWDCCEIVVRLLWDCCEIVVRLLWDCCEIVFWVYRRSRPSTPNTIWYTIWNQPHTIASGIEANKPPNRLKTHITHSDCVFIFSSFHDFRV